MYKWLNPSVDFDSNPSPSYHLSWISHMTEINWSAQTLYVLIEYKPDGVQNAFSPLNPHSSWHFVPLHQPCPYHTPNCSTSYLISLWTRELHWTNPFLHSPSFPPYKFFKMFSGSIRFDDFVRCLRLGWANFAPLHITFDLDCEMCIFQKTPHKWWWETGYGFSGFGNVYHHFATSWSKGYLETLHKPKRKSAYGFGCSWASATAISRFLPHRFIFKFIQCRINMDVEMV